MPEPIVAPLAPGQVLRIGPSAGTGTSTGDYGIGATDLCEFMDFPTEVTQVCGDSFAGQGVGFGGYYSPIALRVDMSSVDDPAGLRYTGVFGVGQPLLADPTPPGASQLPAGVVQINRQNYVLITTAKIVGAPEFEISQSLTDTWALADRCRLGAGRRLPGWSAVADQRLLRPDPYGRVAEWVGLHRRRQLRPQPTARAVSGRAGEFRRPVPVAGLGAWLRWRVA